MADIAPDTCRDYTVKVSVSREGRRLGLLPLYFSPKKQSFSLGTREMTDQEVIPELERIWHGDPAHEQVVALGGADGCHAYVDGSCVNESIGYGFVLLKGGYVIDEDGGPVTDPGLQGMRQVGGEIKAVLEAVAACQRLGVDAVTIHHDMEGLERWATGEWKANTPATTRYAVAAREWAVQVTWNKVASHTGDRWNTHVDRLAREAASEVPETAVAKADPLAEAERMARAFAEILTQRGMTARYAGTINGQAARICVGTGVLDLYNTKKRPLSKPYIHDFGDHTLQSRVESLWREWHEGSAEGGPVEEDLLAEARYYFDILAPYRDCQFDFVLLAESLARACERSGRPAPDREAIRYDFARLATLYSDLRGSIS